MAKDSKDEVVNSELTPIVATFLGIGTNTKGQMGVYVAKIDVANNKILGMDMHPEPDRIESEFRFKVLAGEILMGRG